MGSDFPNGAADLRRQGLRRLARTAELVRRGKRRRTGAECAPPPPNRRAGSGHAAWYASQGNVHGFARLSGLTVDENHVK